MICSCGRETHNAGGRCTRCVKKNEGYRSSKQTELINGTLHLPPAELPAHETRIAAHGDRVAAEIRRLNQGGEHCA